MSAEPQVMVLTPDWHEAVVAVEQAGQPHPWSARQLAEALAAKDHQVVGVVGSRGNGDELLGFAVLACLPFEAELQAITVAPAARRQGVAKALLERLIATATDWGSERLLLEVRASNAQALGLYRGLGFIEEGRRRGYYPAAEASSLREDALLMGRGL
ncbi:MULTISPECIES: ribosomal protein S18-alanine N-acetyltransferase [Halomonadaceae]|uniref:[SSU ribosomal protein S18P]-alanine acetyltransferase n=1 Tax=Onishia taeanensis TaxID=284577 RepID=A0A328Y515_9GAMM|nr:MULTISPECIES: ribosomal protein S18-alanine N-acetyltransferase [Halomonas]RAR63646.1 [SSU ribosomal protein S18P]-alanine acetyltransferase [Halomonas taeanensis]